MIPAEDVEVHFVMCLTKPRVTYNGKLTVFFVWVPLICTM